jgi:hypothetical protein
VTYDYTDKGFSEHFVRVWRKLRQDGIRGVKVDYPATAWRPEGGFDDRYATTNCRLPPGVRAAPRGDGRGTA